MIQYNKGFYDSFNLYEITGFVFRFAVLNLINVFRNNLQVAACILIGSNTTFLLSQWLQCLFVQISHKNIFLFYFLKRLNFRAISLFLSVRHTSKIFNQISPRKVVRPILNVSCNLQDDVTANLTKISHEIEFHQLLCNIIHYTERQL